MLPWDVRQDGAILNLVITIAQFRQAVGIQQAANHARTDFVDPRGLGDVAGMLWVIGTRDLNPRILRTAFLFTQRVGQLNPLAVIGGGGRLTIGHPQGGQGDEQQGDERCNGVAR